MWDSPPAGEAWEFSWVVHDRSGVDGCVFGSDGNMYTWRSGRWLISTRCEFPQWDEMDRFNLAKSGAILRGGGVYRFAESVSVVGDAQ